MCEALEVSVSGYYAWAARPDSPTAVWRRNLVGAIEEIHAEVKGRYGSPRMTAELNARGHECSENTVAELMREHGIRAKAPRRFVRTTDSNHRLPVAANVLDWDFDPDGPNHRWCADITYIPTREGWLYLAAVEDLFSRMIVGWSMSESMESRLVVDALEMAIQRRRPGAGLLAHLPGESHGPAGGRRQQVTGAPQHVGHALLVDRPLEPLVRGKPVVVQDARPAHADDPLKDCGTALGVDGVRGGPVTDPGVEPGGVSPDPPPRLVGPHLLGRPHLVEDQCIVLFQPGCGTQVDLGAGPAGQRDAEQGLEDRRDLGVG